MRHIDLRFVVLACVAWLSASACSNSSDSAPGDPKAFPHALAQHFCQADDRCGGEPTFNATDCVARMTASEQDGRAGYIVTLIEHGQVNYDADAASACLSTLDTLDCSAPLDARTFCVGVFSGKGKVGDSCSVDQECGAKLYCDKNNACPGACHAYAALGAACDSAKCADDSSCLNNVCVANLEEHAACSNSSADCRIGLLCLNADGTAVTGAADPGTCTSPTKTKRAKLGEACSGEPVGVQCESDLACSGVPGTAPTCQKRTAPNQACLPGYPNSCAGEYYCTAYTSSAGPDGVCKALPKVGEACSGMDRLPCAYGLVCFADNHCRIPGRIGDACKDNVECAGHNCAGNVCKLDDPCQ